MRKTHNAKTQIPIPGMRVQGRRCNVKDELAAAVLTVHSNGIHMQTTRQPATKATAKVEKMGRPTIIIVCGIQRKAILLPYPLEQLCRRNKTQRQRHGHTIARMLQGTILKRPHKECRQFTHQQICGRGDDSDEKTCRERKHYGHLCTTSQHASRPG